jgi:GNAT superfamily N-acetyltransferase
MVTDGKIQIRPLQADDFDAWMPLWRGYQAFYKVDLSDSTSRTAFARMLDPDEPTYGMLAIVDGRPVGLVHVIRHRSNWTIGDYAYLQDLFVDDSVRGRGVGRALIEAVYARAADEGCARVYWLTHETNTDAMKLYDRIGDKSGFIQYRKAL